MTQPSSLIEHVEEKSGYGERKFTIIVALFVETSTAPQGKGKGRRREQKKKETKRCRFRELRNDFGHLRF